MNNSANDRASTSTYTERPGELGRLRDNANATATELMEFMEQLRGKSPQEAMGVVAQSTLFVSTIQATLAVLVLMAVFTAGPYYLRAVAPAENKEAAAASADQGEAPADGKAAEARAADGKGKSTKAADGKGGEALPGEGKTAARGEPREPAAGKDLAEKLGVGEVKTGDPKFNPLDRKEDDLLKDLK